MKKNLPLSLTAIRVCTTAGIIAACAYLSPLNAQTLQQRATIQQLNDNSKLELLKQKFTLKHSLQEAEVQRYLQQHPQEKRSFVKNGSFYFLKYIDAQGNPIYIKTRNVASGKVISAHQLYPGGTVGANVTGNNMLVGVWDGGQVRATHELLAGKVTMQPNQNLNNTEGNDHMTHVTGTIIGRKLSNKPDVHGIAYEATSHNYDFSNDLPEMTSFAGSGYLISNHSYGAGNDDKQPKWQFGAYDNEARNWDELLAKVPYYLPFVAGGNEQTTSGNNEKGGYDLMTSSSAAKNTVTVGAVNGDSTMSTYSNWGPTDDGRFKPDLVTKGTGINSSKYGADDAYSGSDVTSSGTSYASPAAAGAALLLQQYHNNISGKYMRSATLKALLLHTAFDLGNPGPDYKFGWGLLDAAKAGMLIKGTYSTNKTAIIREYDTNPENTGKDDMITSVVAKGGEPLVISLCWTDDAGTEQTADDKIDDEKGHLVYSFDMAATKSNDNTEHRPWKPMGMKNRTENAEKAGKWFDEDNNNYKQIVIDDPDAGATYNIAMRKSASSPATVRPFTLIVSGIESTSVLPIHLQSFTAAPAGANNTLSWRTATEDVGGTFTLQHSKDGSTFTDRAVVKGNGFASVYHYTDNKPLQPTTYYRLKVKEADGSIIYSSIEKVQRTFATNSISIAPVPATTTVTLVTNNSQLNGTIATLTDMMGRQIRKITLKASQQIDISGLKAGTYILRLTNGETVKIMKQ